LICATCFGARSGLSAIVTSPSFSVTIMVLSGSAARAISDEPSSTITKAIAEASFRDFIDCSCEF